MVATSEAEMLAQEAALDEVKPSVIISGEAHKHYASMFRLWSGWPKAGIIFDDPMPVSPWAYTDHDTQTVVVNPDELILNPNRLLLTMTPYRMKQEAVLTGTLLHEAGHARFSLWLPKNAKEAAKFKHKDGSPISKQTLAFANLLEEPRVDGLMARGANEFGAVGLAWTMRAAAAHLIPNTQLSNDPDQQVMDVITSWALRAGRHLATAHWVTSHGLNNWVNDLTALCQETIQAHLFRVDDPQPMVTSQQIMSDLMGLLHHLDHKGLTGIEMSKSILDRLFPNGDGDSDDAPQPGGGCHSQKDENGGQSDEQPNDEDQDPSGTGEALQDLLNSMEDEAEQDAGQSEAEAQQEKDSRDKDEEDAKKEGGGLTGGDGRPEVIKGRFREPTPEERDIQKGAERFLRGMINPTTTNTVTLSSSPGATVDPSALAAWKAGGQITEPHFFKRTKRTVKAAPPIKIATLVDVSSSMNILQKPSAILSWALASAALDLRNFAGRGVQVESTLIHWGTGVEVIQKNGQVIPGIREVDCNQGTNAMHLAFDAIEDEMPGFFDAPSDGKPVSRLIVQFTDWQLFGRCVDGMKPRLSKALDNGVNMLTVFPGSYSQGDLPAILNACPYRNGKSETITYDPSMPGEIWNHAVETMA